MVAGMLSIVLRTKYRVIIPKALETSKVTCIITSMIQSYFLREIRIQIYRKAMCTYEYIVFYPSSRFQLWK